MRTDNPAYPSLIEYGRVLRSRWKLILGVTLACAALALALSIVTTPSYSATAQLTPRDESQDLALIGSEEVPQAQGVLAANDASNVLRAAVVAPVAKALGLTPAQVRGDVTASVDATTNNIDIAASAHSGSLAARLANAVATTDAELTSSAERRSLAAEAAQLDRTVVGAQRNTAAGQATAARVSSLYALSTIADPLSVQQMASAPASPSSPKPVRDTFLGLVIGLIIGILVALLRNATDRRVVDVTEIEALVDLTRLGQIDEATIGLGRLGSEHARFDVRDIEVFRMIRQNAELVAGDSAGRALAVMSPAPREGKTTTAVGIAVASALAGKRTLLIEGDLRRPHLSERLGLAVRPGLAEFLTGAAAPQDVLQSLDVTTVADGLRAESCFLTCILAGRSSAEPADLMTSPGFARFMAEVKSVYDLVVVDTPPVLAVADAMEIAKHCEDVVMCVRAHSTLRSEAVSGRALIDRMPSRPLGVVVTGVRRSDAESYGYYGDYRAPESGHVNVFRRAAAAARDSPIRSQASPAAAYARLRQVSPPVRRAVPRRRARSALTQDPHPGGRPFPLEGGNGRPAPPDAVPTP